MTKNVIRYSQILKLDKVNPISHFSQYINTIMTKDFSLYVYQCLLNNSKVNKLADTKKKIKKPEPAYSKYVIN